MAGKLNDVQKNDMSAWLPKNAESTKALEQTKKFQPTDAMPALVVYDRGSDGVSSADVAKAQQDVAAFKKMQNVSEVVGPVPSQDGKAIQTIVMIKFGKEGETAAGKIVDALLAQSQSAADGLHSHVTGPVGYAADSIKIFSSVDTLIGITIGVVIVILLVTYRSPVLWLLPILSAVVALNASMGLVYLLAKYAGLTVTGQSSFILPVLAFGAATDYALLLIARYREELRRHADRHTAMAQALQRPGPAIVASAATVAISLLCLVFAAVNSTKGLGPVCAIGIGVGLLAMITLFPSLLVICGRGIFWPIRPTIGTAESTERGFWATVGRGIAARPRLTWIGTALALSALALASTGLKTGSLPTTQTFTHETQAVIGERIQTTHFPSGAGQPLSVVANAASCDQVSATLAGIPGITEVTQPIVKDDQCYLEGTLTASADSTAAKTAILQARTELHKLPRANALVGGGPAIILDFNDASAHDRGLIIPVVLLVVFGILALLLRAVVAPLLLIATVVLSFMATVGVSAMVFNHLFQFLGADTSFPLWTFVFLVALGIDYNIFLVTRVKEEAAQRGTRRGALVGLAATGGVITSAGLVLAGTFAALGSMPMVFMAELGFAVAFGVLLDTIIVRSVLVTALALDLGRWMWWPSHLVGRQDDAEAPTGAEEPQAA